MSNAGSFSSSFPRLEGGGKGMGDFENQLKNFGNHFWGRGSKFASSQIFAQFFFSPSLNFFFPFVSVFSSTRQNFATVKQEEQVLESTQTRVKSARINCSRACMCRTQGNSVSRQEHCVINNFKKMTKGRISETQQHVKFFT